ncbi:hypothetical protein GCM10009528_27150 [Kineococcus aurantiacus]
MTPDSRSARTRSKQVEGAIPTCCASAAFVVRASSASTRRIARSTGSTTRRSFFGWTPPGGVRLEASSTSQACHESSAGRLSPGRSLFTLDLPEDTHEEE